MRRADPDRKEVARCQAGIHNRIVTDSLPITATRYLECLMLFAVMLGGASPVQAQFDRAPIVVVVESDFRETEAADIRDAIAESLGVPVIRLTDGRAEEARGTLSIAVTRDGRHAHVYYRLARGTERAVLVEVVAGRGADAEGRWLAEPAASVVRTLEQWIDMEPASEVLDPWLAERVQPTSPGEIQILAELADPFEGEPAREVDIVVDRYFYGSEVINPWAQANNPESADRLATPSATPAP